ncbi:hypothetical protein MMC16_002763 [Acarospora aff. strigata]|nr:hypothetical protein [Acarospora aff. strigata]
MAATYSLTTGRGGDGGETDTLTAGKREGRDGDDGGPKGDMGGGAWFGELAVRRKEV